MCYDQEKTQGTPRPYPLDRDLVDEKLMHDQIREANGRPEAQIGRALNEAEIVAELFRYHPPRPRDLAKYSAINQAAKNFAEVLLQNCPPCADRSASIRMIREARMTANAAIALDGLSL